MENNHQQEQMYLLHHLHQFPWPPPPPPQQQQPYHYHHHQQQQEQQHGVIFHNENSQNLLDCMPCGYRFCPTDEELIMHYLKKRLAKSPLPLNRIREANVYAQSPQELASKYLCDSFHNVNGWYFFTHLTNKYTKGSRPSRSCATGGFWKLTGKDKGISYQGHVVGYRKTLDFFLGSPPGQKTAWKMHEYRIRKQSPQSDPVLCKLYLTMKRKNDHDNGGDKEEMANENLDQGMTVNEAFMQNENGDLIVSNISPAGSANFPSMESVTTPNTSSNSSGDTSSNQVVYDMPNFQCDQHFQDFQGYNNYYYYGGFDSTSPNTHGFNEQFELPNGVTMITSNLNTAEDPKYNPDGQDLSNLRWQNYCPDGFISA